MDSRRYDAGVVLAAGSGVRFGGSGPTKTYVDLAGRPLVAYSLEALAAVVERIVLVIREDDVDDAGDVVDDLALPVPVVMTPGGATRTQSERVGIEALQPLRDSLATVAVHDAARPFLTGSLLRRLQRAALEHGGAVPVIPFSGLTVWRDTGRPAGSDLYRVQTPQVFRGDVLFEAFAAAGEFEAPDTSELVRRFVSSATIRAVPGDPRNLKVTVAADLELLASDAPYFRKGEWVG